MVALNQQGTVLVGVDLSIDEDQRRKDVEALILPEDLPYCDIFHMPVMQFHPSVGTMHVPLRKRIWWRIRNALVDPVAQLVRAMC